MPIGRVVEALIPRMNASHRRAVKREVMSLMD
jgi:hypothetical protein